MEKLIIRLGKGMDIIAGIFITFTVLLTVCDVILRNLGKPIPGTFEIVGFAGGAMGLGISSLFTYWKKSHIRIDTIVEKFPKNINHIFYMVTRVMVIFITGLTGVSLMIMGFQLLEAKEVTSTLFFPYYPIVWVVGVPFLIVCLVVLYEVISWRR